jgi:predicted DNA-binding transcriptional regulator YafY
LAQRTGVSEVTVQRGLNWLRDTHDAPLEYDRLTHQWMLRDPDFALPLADPTADDLGAVVFAAALVAPLGDDRLNARLERMIEQMDARVRESGAASAFRYGTLTAGATTTTRVDPRTLATLARAVGRRVVRLGYASPWSGQTASHEVEPWQLRVHDGAMYLRAWCRTTDSARTFRVAQVATAVVIEGTTPAHAVPGRDALWGDGDPAFGIDHDRPGTARIRVAGGIARWLAALVWHPEQRDVWVVPGEILERTLPYPSCRELARRLLSLGSGLREVDPPELRAEVRLHAQSLAEHSRD